MKTEKEELTSPRLKSLEKNLEKVQKAGDFLKKEMEKVMEDKEIVKNKIRKEKEIINLKKRIESVKKK